MHVLQHKPRFVLRHKKLVYKVLSASELEQEKCIECLRHYIDIYNNNRDPERLSIAIPQIKYFENFVEMPFLPHPNCSTTLHYIDVYKTITHFSNMFVDGELTVSLGDFQIKNIFLSDGLHAIDLGEKSGTKVPIFYDRARFILNLIDSGISDAAKDILHSEKGNEELNHQLKLRSLYLVTKRLKAKKALSAIYRYFCYLNLRSLV